MLAHFAACKVSPRMEQMDSLLKTRTELSQQIPRSVSVDPIDRKPIAQHMLQYGHRLREIYMNPKVVEWTGLASMVGIDWQLKWMSGEWWPECICICICICIRMVGTDSYNGWAGNDDQNVFGKTDHRCPRKYLIHSQPVQQHLRNKPLQICSGKLMQAKDMIKFESVTALMGLKTQGF